MAQALPLILTAVSTVVAVQGARRQAKAQEQAANFNAQVAEQNAQAARQQAQAEATQIERKNRLRLGAARASIGAAGITPEGSAIDVMGDIVAQGELERQQALHEGEMRARGFDVDRTLSRAEGKEARVAGRFAAGSALLGGASTFSQQGTRLNLWGAEAG